MIFYLIPPKVTVDLRSFNQCCISRFGYFFNADFNDGDGETMIESVIPGTELDKVGHFILRCFCLNRPDVAGFVLQKETRLFINRLNVHKSREIRKYCVNALKDLSQIGDSFQGATNGSAVGQVKSYFGAMVLSSLKEILLALKQKLPCEHIKNECHENCRRYRIEIPFQVCSSMVRRRRIELRQGRASVPCSMWIELLEEAFVHHFNVGLSMISGSVLRSINSDSRWQSTFRALYDMYDCYGSRPSIRRSKILHRHVDVEKRHFPPCMSHLLSVLRENHRLTHIWRYYFSLFLKDIGLKLEESLEFWKKEYSQSCSTGSSCTHSWQQNERKYRYSIRHLYGLEGAKIEKSCKSCHHIQTMQIGMRDEGGCPFVHFDDSNLISTLCDTVKRNKNVVDEIIELKNLRKPSEACMLHMKFSLELAPDECRANNESSLFESPAAYYFCKKDCANKSLEW